MDNGIGNWVSVHHARTPDKVALIDANTGKEYSYADIERRTNVLAAQLRAKGVRKGDRVACVLFNSPHFLELVIATAKLGAISVPINFRLTAPEIRYILEDSAACLLFASTQVIETARAAITDTYVRELIEIPSAAKRAESPDSEYERLVTEGDSSRVEIDIQHHEIAMLMYTSGTTGFPKGTMLTHGNHFWNAVNSVGMGMGLTPRDVSMTAAPLFHIGAFGVFTLPLFYLGGTSVILESFTPDQWLHAVEQFKPTVAFCVPAMWAAIVTAGVSDRNLDSLRCTVSGGAPCPIPVIEALQGQGVVFTEGFGLTETAPCTSVLDADSVIAHAGSVGKPLLHVDYRIVDEAGHDLPTGEVGELLIRGPNVFIGYWQKPEATREALQNGWFHSGDLAKVDEEGYYFIVDRKKDMVISGGENVYPAEVEQALYRHPAIAEVAVIGIPDEKWGEAVTAVVALKPGQQLSAEELIDWTREKLAGFKRPRRVSFVDALPRTTTGKVLKRELRKQWSGDGAAVHR